jgi:hypothetical protein
MCVALSDWLTGRRPAGIAQGFVRAFRANQWSPGSVALVVFAVAIGGVSSNLLAAMISELGWTETFARFPLKAGIYAGLVLTSAVVTTIVVVR